ncbi:uncharacterized protein SPSK_10147 [Sporothrix schenckii 1099-18]|uniref:Uncharacterized protein n=1 Tax=Sporothrix schenckii 1099-18 TaxID=1397361 RepID=A0A0F2MA96_SPOSC|nr:uncharacterized protein SPSK_10147 [Sporothrix schenckii 1099-18]KJR85755.1 hypothetical protein SPSK_10147 [Sporothrix schenckii 1099-18]
MTGESRRGQDNNEKKGAGEARRKRRAVSTTGPRMARVVGLSYEGNRHIESPKRGRYGGKEGNEAETKERTMESRRERCTNQAQSRFWIRTS